MAREPSLRIENGQLRIYVEVIGNWPNFAQANKGYDFINGPTGKGNPMSHDEFLAMVTPQDMYSSAGIKPAEIVTMAAVNVVGQWAIVKALTKIGNYRKEKQMRDIQAQIDAELAAIKKVTTREIGRGDQRAVTRIASLTGRGPAASDGLFTISPFTTIVVDPPPSRFSAFDEVETIAQRDQLGERHADAVVGLAAVDGHEPQVPRRSIPMSVRGWRMSVNVAGCSDSVASQFDSVTPLRRSSPAPLMTSRA